MTQPPLSDLSEAERAPAFERFDLLCPGLEERDPLARKRGIALRTARRWAGQYRREGPSGLARQHARVAGATRAATANGCKDAARPSGPTAVRRGIRTAAGHEVIDRSMRQR
ncbi:hypothetical protein V5E97_08445 [Singulisphaera sp. Ch08]|uniref:Helix-turn-helix domain-containing protein n=1 Tax=Singulisphaera sp. Ch08 TaxID=3120278 RepID=A0AAU7CLY0_9BACT